MGNCCSSSEAIPVVDTSQMPTSIISTTNNQEDLSSQSTPFTKNTTFTNSSTQDETNNNTTNVINDTQKNKGITSVIEVYLRVKPSNNPSGYFARDAMNETHIIFTPPTSSPTNSQIRPTSSSTFSSSTSTTTSTTTARTRPMSSSTWTTQATQATQCTTSSTSPTNVRDFNYPPKQPQNQRNNRRKKHNSNKKQQKQQQQQQQQQQTYPQKSPKNAKLKPSKFQFNGIFDETCTQEDIFTSVGKPTVDNVLNGFNSTIFAYGQTGSGKTFTMSGKLERFEHGFGGFLPLGMNQRLNDDSNRGIIPRAISMLFSQMRSQEQQHTNMSYSCSLSYLEVYNEKGYDLLSDTYSSIIPTTPTNNNNNNNNNNTETTNNTDKIPRVSIMESDDGKCHIRNLSVHKVSNEDDALQLLLLGGKNRVIGETQMNKQSSRSHCILSIMVEKRNTSTDTFVRSKLNLVDLAGSERVSKTNAVGKRLTESCHINVSLLYLQMVITALHEKSVLKKRTHVPYRNSMVTSILRDSLGGNCKTIMIGAISSEAEQTEESLSTCQFAQRVMKVKNKAFINEELEPELVIRGLREEVQRLRNEMKHLKKMNRQGTNGEDDKSLCSSRSQQSLSSQQLDQLQSTIQQYVNDDNNDDKLDIGSLTRTKIYAAFSILKELCKTNNFN